MGEVGGTQFSVESNSLSCDAFGTSRSTPTAASMMGRVRRWFGPTQHAGLHGIVATARAANVTGDAVRWRLMEQRHWAY